jgi:hypothetical protein
LQGLPLCRLDDFGEAWHIDLGCHPDRTASRDRRETQYP